MKSSLGSMVCLTTLMLVGMTATIKPEARGQTERLQCGLADADIGQFVSVPSGSFTMAEDPLYREEGKPRQRAVTGFDIQIHEVTNGQFAQFVKATGYITSAEKAVASTVPGAGSAVFRQPDRNSIGNWQLTNGATWRTPAAEVETEARDRQMTLPVVHIAHDDAKAYAKWAGGRLPTEIEWEYAASLGLPKTPGRYRGAFDEKGKPIANTWQGIFPAINQVQDGFEDSAPVGCFPASEIGLYDMIGNVWEWTASASTPVTHTIKGGSFLCAPNYCRRYRPSARQAHETDFSTNHIGFRIVKDRTPSRDLQ
ncbi:MAG: formylglycine-generating enzyme family protein [Pseudomonadota bacterium]